MSSIALNWSTGKLQSKSNSPPCTWSDRLPLKEEWFLSFSYFSISYLSGDVDLENHQALVIKLAERLWEQIRSRIARNVALKCHHFFLVPMYPKIWVLVLRLTSCCDRETELPFELQTHFTCLSDQQIAEIFEVLPMKQKLELKCNKLKEKLASWENELKLLQDSVATFSQFN